MRKTIPGLKPSLVHLYQMSLALHFEKEEPEEQAKGKDDKTRLGEG